MPEPIPSSPSDVTPEWVTAALREAGALPRGRVTAVRVEPIGADGGVGFAGDTVRLRLDYDGVDHGAAHPPSVSAKFPTADRQNRGMLEQYDAYAREIRFYRRFAHRVPGPIPAYLGADFDEKGARRTGPRLSRLIDALPDVVQLAMTRDVTKYMRATNRRYALLLEDLGGDTVVHDMADPPDEARLGITLDALAALHAAFWGQPDLAGDETFRPVLTTTPGLFATVGRKRCLPMARQRWMWFDDQATALVLDALDRFADDVALLNTPHTLVHGDPRSDNLLYGADGRVVLVDWALAGHAHPAFDVGYLLCSCVTADRLAEIDRLLDRYHAALVGHGVDMDPGHLRDGVAAAYRGEAVVQLLSIAVLHGEGYGDQRIFDLWMPRIVAGLGHEW